jgi:2-aminoethylphosphonate-pyruvate transaminase
MDAQGYVLYPGKGPLLEQNCFQIANMGWIQPDDCRRLLHVLESTLRTSPMPSGPRPEDRLG